MAKATLKTVPSSARLSSKAIFHFPSDVGFSVAANVRVSSLSARHDHETLHVKLDQLMGFWENSPRHS